MTDTKQLISALDLKTILPHAPHSALNSFLTEFNKQLPVYSINTPIRIAAFLAQGAVESGELRTLVENMNYSAPRIMAVWPSRFKTLAAAQPYSHNPQLLGSNVYANRMGNGNAQSGDGYKYRGRGFFSGTGKSFYQKMTTLTGTDFIGNPDLLATAHYAVLSACQFWKSAGLNALADAGNIKAITQKVNGGFTGLAERTTYYNKAKKILGITS